MFAAAGALRRVTGRRCRRAGPARGRAGGRRAGGRWAGSARPARVGRSPAARGAAGPAGFATLQNTRILEMLMLA